MANSATTSNAMRLPAELLSAIFAICVNEECPEAPDPLRDGSCKCAGNFCIGVPWIKVTYVCSYWRQVALSDCTLWSTMHDVHSPRWLHEILRRSGNAAPLDVQLLASTLPNDAELFRFIRGLVSDHHHQISRLSLSLAPQQADAIIDLLCHSFDALNLLNFSVIGPCTALPDSFLGTDPVTLRHLQLHACFIPWKSLGLKTPHLTTIELYARHTTDLNDLCYALASMPELQSLKLVQVDTAAACLSFHPSAPSAVQSVALVTLPRLKTLWLLPMVSTDVIRLLQRLSLPALEDLQLRCIFDMPYATALNRLFDCLNPFKETILGTSNLPNRLEISAGIGYPWHEWTCIHPQTSWTDSSRRITLGFMPMVGNADWVKELRPVLESRFAFSQVEELSSSLFDIEDLENESWFSTLSSMRQIKTLRITGELPSLRTLLKMLVKYDDELFPGIRTIKYRFKEAVGYVEYSDLADERVSYNREVFARCLPLLLERCVFPGSSLRSLELEPIESVQGGLEDVDWNAMFAEIFSRSLLSHCMTLNLGN